MKTVENMNSNCKHWNHLPFLKLPLTYSTFSYNVRAALVDRVLRGCLPKSGLVDLGWKIDFAHFVCVERLSCTYTKTTIRLIGSFKFLEFEGFSVHPMERLWRAISRLKFYPTLKSNLTKTNKPCTKQTPQPVIISLFNLLKRLLWPLSLNPASGETLTTYPLHN